MFTAFGKMLNRDQAPDADATETHNVHDQEKDTIPNEVQKLTSYSSDGRLSRNQAGKRRKRVFSRRTKTGCMTCRARKKKCDETRPYCELSPSLQRFLGLTMFEVTIAGAVDSFANGIIAKHMSETLERQEINTSAI
jgi:hypothetical protein